MSTIHETSSVGVRCQSLHHARLSLLNTETTTTAVAIHSHVTEAAYQKFHGKNPYLDDVVECLDNDVKVGASRGLVDYKNDTPKLHCIEDHAVDALERFPDLLLMIEEWVEQFHQTEKKRVENRVRFIKDAFKRAESASKKRAAVNDSTLMVQSRRTKKARGGYKPKNVYLNLSKILNLSTIEVVRSAENVGNNRIWYPSAVLSIYIGTSCVLNVVLGS